MLVADVTMYKFITGVRKEQQRAVNDGRLRATSLSEALQGLGQ
jgi:hypothetical protein